MSKKDKEMSPISREIVDVEGVYTDETGHEEHLHRGEEFPADLMLGTTEWELTELVYDNHHQGQTDKRLVPKKD